MWQLAGEYVLHLHVTGDFERGGCVRTGLRSIMNWVSIRPIGWVIILQAAKNPHSVWAHFTKLQSIKPQRPPPLSYILEQALVGPCELFFPITSESFSNFLQKLICVTCFHLGLFLQRIYLGYIVKIYLWGSVFHVLSVLALRKQCKKVPIELTLPNSHMFCEGITPRTSQSKGKPNIYTMFQFSYQFNQFPCTNCQKV